VILLDTLVIVTIGLGKAMPVASRQVIADGAVADDLWLSTVSGWELGLLATTTGRTGPLIGDARLLLNAVQARLGLRWLPLAMDVAVAAAYLPEPFHKDPADRLLVATARTHGATLVTSDRRILAYAEAGHVAAIAA
jgi:PIN domain nuclease of toxin-antitoxin system